MNNKNYYNDDNEDGTIIFHQHQTGEMDTVIGLILTELCIFVNYLGLLKSTQGK